MSYAQRMEPKSLKEFVAGEVRAQLARRGLSAVRAAKELGWTQAYISRRMTGVTAFDLDDLESLALLLDVPVGAFFGARDDYPRALIGARRFDMGGPMTNSDLSVLTLISSAPESPESLFVPYGHFVPSVA